MSELQELLDGLEAMQQAPIAPAYCSIAKRTHGTLTRLRARVAELEAEVKVETAKKLSANMDLVKAEVRVAELEARVTSLNADNEHYQRELSERQRTLNIQAERMAEAEAAVRSRDKTIDVSSGVVSTLMDKISKLEKKQCDCGMKYGNGLEASREE